jgi:enamine deaminase RidA (YjgF/YER057c/UK114 family)
MERKYLKARAGMPFSDGVLAAGTLYLSGRIGFLPGTTVVPASPEDEAKYLMDGVRQVLADASMQTEDLVYVQIFCSDLSLWDRFNAVYSGYFSGDLPARAFLGVQLLSGARFELQAIAQARSA